MSASLPRLCVGLPVYNGEKYLAQALDSLLEQTCADFQLLIADNASTDGTERICRTYAARDPRIRYYRNTENIGAARNWYYVFELCQCEYFKWAAHDDIYAPEFLQRCVEALDQDHSIILCYTRTKVIDAHGNFERDFALAGDTHSTKPHVRLYSMIGIDLLCVQMYGVMRAEALRKAHVYMGYPGWDRNTLAELSLMGRICELPEYLFYHRLYPEAWGAAINSGMSIQKLLLYDPTINWSARITFSKRFYNYFAAVSRVPLGRFERMLCYLQLLRLIADKSARRFNVAFRRLGS